MTIKRINDLILDELAAARMLGAQPAIRIKRAVSPTVQAVIDGYVASHGLCVTRA